MGSTSSATSQIEHRPGIEAAGVELASGGEEFARRGGEVVGLADDLGTFVGHLVDALLKRHGVNVTSDTVEVPTLLRSARNALEQERGHPPTRAAAWSRARRGSEGRRAVWKWSSRLRGVGGRRSTVNP